MPRKEYEDLGELDPSRDEQNLLEDPTILPEVGPEPTPQDEPWFTWRTPIERWLEENVYRPAAGAIADQLDFATYDLEPKSLNSLDDVMAILGADPKMRNRVVMPTRGHDPNIGARSDWRLSLASLLGQTVGGYVAPWIEERLRHYAAGDPYAFSIGDQALAAARAYKRAIDARKRAAMERQARQRESISYPEYRQRLTEAADEQGQNIEIDSPDDVIGNPEPEMSQDTANWLYDWLKSLPREKPVVTPDNMGIGAIRAEIPMQKQASEYSAGQPDDSDIESYDMHQWGGYQLPEWWEWYGSDEDTLVKPSPNTILEIREPSLRLRDDTEYYLREPSDDAEYYRFWPEHRTPGNVVQIDQFDDRNMYAASGYEMSDAMRKLLGYGSQPEAEQAEEDDDEEQAYADTQEIIGVYPGVKLGQLNGKIAIWKNTLRGRWIETFDNYIQAKQWLEQNTNKLAQR